MKLNIKNIEKIYKKLAFEAEQSDYRNLFDSKKPTPSQTVE